MVEKSESIKEHVRNRYSEVARRAESDVESCCNAGCSTGYSPEELQGLPESVVGACAGCGNPTALAGLKEGEVVLDLGSGGGIDVFLAAQKVGPSGRAIGVDMTQDMVDLAKKNADEMGLGNVEFRLGDIENLPVESGSADVIISNCVINLAPDKDRVFSEAYRVLKPGGRMTISDIVTDGELPESIRDDPDAWAECIAGALEEGAYLEKLKRAGFRNVKVLSKRSFMEIVYSVEVEAHKPRS